MKHHLFVFLVIALAFGSSSSYGQYTKNSWELSFMGSAGSFSFDTDEEGQGYLHLSIIPSYYIIDGLAIEPEIGALFDLKHGDNNYYMLIGNLSYTFKLQGNVSPFAHVGIGISNGIEWPYGAGIGDGNDEVSTTIVQFGAGVKILVGQSAAIRLGLEYQSQAYSYKGGSDRVMTNIGMKMGVSLLL